MSDNGLVWEDPPAQKGRNRGLWRERLAPLVERPNEWARIAEYPTPDTAAATAANLRRAHTKKPSGEWEFASRKVSGKGYVYARYLGPEKAPA